MKSSINKTKMKDKNETKIMLQFSKRRNEKNEKVGKN